MSTEEKATEEKTHEQKQDVVKLVVSALRNVHPEADIAGVEIVYLCVTHDPNSENHENCTWTPRHIGGSAIPDAGIVMELAKATAHASLDLRSRAQKLKAEEKDDEASDGE